MTNKQFSLIKKSLLDEYDEDGNYIGDDTALMDSESKTETDGDD